MLFQSLLAEFTQKRGFDGIKIRRSTTCVF
jgi:hypothetical protein